MHDAPNQGADPVHEAAAIVDAYLTILIKPDPEGAKRKRFESTDVVAGASSAHAVVYNRGTLYGEWLDGSAFEGNRYVDRYVIRDGLICEMDVWNDSAERLLDKRSAA